MKSTFVPRLNVAAALFMFILFFQNCTPSGIASSAANSSGTAGLASESPAAPTRSGFSIQTQEFFNFLDLNHWEAQSANSPAAINLSTDVGNAYGEVEAYLPNQYQLLSGGGIRLVSTHQSFSAIGGDANMTCADATVSTCSFPWTSAELSGKPGLQSGYGYYEWSVKLPAVPAGGLGTWPATWLLGGENAPQYEEIDFMERFSNDPSVVNFTLHYGNGVGDFNNDNATVFCSATDKTGDNWSDVHSFAVDWEPTSITGYIDGVACGTVKQGSAPNQSGSTPVIIPSGLMFPIVNTAIAPNYNSITAANPVHLDVLHYFYYSNNSLSIVPMLPHLSNLHMDKAVYNPGDTAKVFYSISGGSTALTNIAINSVALMDFLGDSSSFQQGSSVNGVFGNWNFYDLTGISVAVGSTYQSSFSVSLPSTLPNGIYTVFIGTLSANGISYAGDYTRLVVGSNSLAPAP